MAKHLILISVLATFSAFAQPPPIPTAAGKLRFTSIESIGAVIPPTINLKPGGEWNFVAVEKANAAVSVEALDRPAILRFKVQVFEPFKERGWGYRIMAPDDVVSVRGTRLPYRMFAYFRPDQADALEKVRKGATITVSGVLGRADIQMNGKQPVLSIDLVGARIENQ